jgi:hypothetical protein
VAGVIFLGILKKSVHHGADTHTSVHLDSFFCSIDNLLVSLLAFVKFDFFFLHLQISDYYTTVYLTLVLGLLFCTYSRVTLCELPHVRESFHWSHVMK